MPSLSYQNHFKFGFNGEWFRLREAAEDVYSVAYGRCTAQPGTFAEASIRAARLIGETAQQPIHVLFSGGVDSEVTMRCFLAAGVPVTAAIMRFQDDLNLHDIEFAIRFCDQHSVRYRLYDLDIIEFMKRVRDYTVPVRCNAPLLAATMWLVDQINGFPVLGQGECYLIQPEQLRPFRHTHAKVRSYHDVEFSPDQWALQESETVNGWYRHFLLRGRDGAPGFHQYTPEQISSYLVDPVVVRGMQEYTNSEDWKLAMYQQHFDLEPRPKYTGYEKMDLFVRQYRRQHIQLFPHALSFVLFDYERLKAALQPL